MSPEKSSDPRAMRLKEEVYACQKQGVETVTTSGPGHWCGKFAPAWKVETRGIRDWIGKFTSASRQAFKSSDRQAMSLLEEAYFCPGSGL